MIAQAWTIKSTLIATVCHQQTLAPAHQVNSLMVHSQSVTASAQASVKVLKSSTNSASVAALILSAQRMKFWTYLHAHVSIMLSAFVSDKILRFIVHDPKGKIEG